MRNMVASRCLPFAALSLLVSPLTRAQTLDLGAVTPSPESQSEGADPQMARILDVYEAIAGTPIIQLSPTDARQQFAAEDAAKIVARATGAAPAPEPVLKVTDGATIPGAAGPLPVRIYTPTRAGSQPLPVVVYFHGGGFVIATIDTYDASARAIANQSGAIVVSVEYRKAPEYPFPAALNDAVASYRWVVANAASIGGNPAKVAVAGESAGGNLATEICLQAKKQGFVMPIYELLIYPVTDFEVDYNSDVQYQTTQPLNTPALLYFTKYYLLNDPSQNLDPDASPIKANLEGLPPTTVIAALIDPLRDEGHVYAEKLKTAGVAVHYQVYPGVTHEFFGMGAVLDKAKAAEVLAGTDLRSAFSK